MARRDRNSSEMNETLAVVRRVCAARASVWPTACQVRGGEVDCGEERREEMG